MSERFLEVARQPDGRFLATFDDRQPAVAVSSWDEVRRLRAKCHLVDHWAAADRQAFIEQYGHPFDHWWRQLSSACAAALLSDPDEPVPPGHLDEVKRTLRHQSRQAGLRLDGSLLSHEVRTFLKDRARAGSGATATAAEDASLP